MWLWLSQQDPLVVLGIGLSIGGLVATVAFGVVQSFQSRRQYRTDNHPRIRMTPELNRVEQSIPTRHETFHQLGFRVQNLSTTRGVSDLKIYATMQLCRRRLHGWWWGKRKKHSVSESGEPIPIALAINEHIAAGESVLMENLNLEINLAWHYPDFIQSTAESGHIRYFCSPGPTGVLIKIAAEYEPSIRDAKRQKSKLQEYTLWPNDQGGAIDWRVERRQYGSRTRLAY